MICQACKNTGIINSVLNKQFYYCRECKIEIPLEIVEATDQGHFNLTEAEIESLCKRPFDDTDIY